MKRFELWLDESGKFNEKPGLQEELYSFIGGVLLASDDLSELHLDEFLTDKAANHAMNMSPTEKKAYVLPVLHQIWESLPIQYVYFENIEYFGQNNNRQLYLDMMAEGILQLVQFLEANHGSIHLSIVIASRLAQKGEARLVHITEKEYQSAFQRALEANQRREEFFKTPTSQVIFRLERATRSQKLIVADFASNSRRLYLNKKLEDAKSRQICQDIFSNALVFSMSEQSIDIKLRVLLSQLDISEALLELFLIPKLGTSRFSYYLSLMIERLSQLSYRLVKSQIRQMASEILAYSARQEDYKETISILERLNQTLLPLLTGAKLPCLEFQLELFLQLSDAYLRSGRFLDAGRVIQASEDLIWARKPILETLMLYYRILEKKAVFYIDSFQFNQAAQLMAEIRLFFKGIFEHLNQSPSGFLGYQFDSSEYFGDVLCMEIYACLFQDHTDLAFVRDLSDLGLTQYPEFEGELERHRQYRSRLERKAGHYSAALYWLMKAILYETEEVELDKQDLSVFWDKIFREEAEMSQLFYLMYYSQIMADLARDGDERANDLYHSLDQHPIFDQVRLPRRKKAESIFLEASLSSYHPKELVWSSLGAYFAYQGNLQAAKTYYQEAIRICRQESQSLSRHLRLVLILADAALMEYRLEGVSQTYPKLSRQLQSLTDKLSRIPESERAYLSETYAVLEEWRSYFATLSEDLDERVGELERFCKKWSY